MLGFSTLKLYTTVKELYEIKQTVALDGKKVALVGQKNITRTRKGAGTTLEAIEQIEAMLVEEEGV